MTEIQDVVESLELLLEDNTVPKNVKGKLSILIDELKQEGDLLLKVNKSLHELDELSNDINLQPFVRTQLWNIASMLESLHS